MNGLPRLTVAAALAVLLTALSLRPTLDGLSWLLPVVACVGVVAASGYVARRYHVPRLLVPLVEIGALTVVLVQRYAHAERVLGVLPGHDVVDEMRVLWDDGIHIIAESGPPAPVTPGLVVVLAASLGLVAVVVDTIAVTYRSPAFAGLPLLVLYAVPVALVPHGVPWAYFGVAAAGWLGLLLADGSERLGGWGRRLGSHTLAGEATGQGTVGRRIGLAAVLLAILLPAVVPGLGAAAFGHGFGGSGDGGGGTVDTVNPFVSLGAALNRPTNGQVLTYTSDDPTPDYLHLVTLTTFDGVTWVPSNLETSGHLADGGPLPPPTGLDPATPVSAVTTTVQLDGLARSTWLPVPYPVTTVRVEGDSGRWVWDTTNRVIWSADTRVDHVGYTATSLAVRPTAELLEAAPEVDPVFVDALTQYPRDVAQSVVDQANQIVAAAKSPLEKALALEGFFRDPANHFTYSTHVPQGTTADPLTSFLEARIGFCQQYAGTYAVMARIVGLPTRVVVGFVPGEKIGDTWSVKWHDLHAWPEVYFEGAGWVRFEPTPSDNTGVTVPDYAVTSPTPTTSSSPTALPSAAVTASPSPAPSDRLTSEHTQGPVAASTWRTPSVWVLAPLLVVAALLVPWAVRLGQRRRRYARAHRGDPRQAAAAAWEELVATSIDLDLAWPASRTPRQVAASLIESVRLERADRAVGPPAADALRRLAVVTERARYARTTDAAPELAADIARVRAGLMASTARFTRLRATFVPRSLLDQVGGRAADMLGWVDATVQNPFSAIPRGRGGRDLTTRTTSHQPRRSDRRRGRRGRPAKGRTSGAGVPRE